MLITPTPSPWISSEDHSPLNRKVQPAQLPSVQIHLQTLRPAYLHSMMLLLASAQANHIHIGLCSWTQKQKRRKKTNVSQNGKKGTAVCGLRSAVCLDTIPSIAFTIGTASHQANRTSWTDHVERWVPHPVTHYRNATSLTLPV